MNALTTTGSNGLMPQSMDAAMKLAEMMSRGHLVPKHLEGSPGDCLMVIEQAMRWGMSPFAVAQSTSVIQGKLMFEGKLVAAALHSSGALSTRLSYEYSGEGDTRQVTVAAMLVGETEPRSVVVRLKDAKTTNGMWTKQPDQQLAYHGARVWARRYAPEVMLGVYSPEEMEPASAAPYTGTTIEAHAEPVTVNTTDTARDLRDGIPALDPQPAPKKQTIAEWLDGLERDLTAAQTPGAVDMIVFRPDVEKAVQSLKNGALERLHAMIRAAQQRTAPPPADDVFPGDLPSREDVGV